MLSNILTLVPALLVLLMAGQAFAAETEIKKDTPLLLEIWINDRTRHLVTPAIQRQGKLLLDAMDLKESGLKIELDEIMRDGYVGSDSLPGVKMQLVEADQKLLITASPDRLLPQLFDLHPDDKAVASRAATGFMGQYDVVGTLNNINTTTQSSGVGAAIGGTLFTPQVNFTANGFSQMQDGMSRGVRLDTNAEFDNVDNLQRWVLGDSISGSQSWSRSVRFGGIQIATDFSMRPDLNTMPLPAFFGQTAVPASVDVFVNSARVFETNVEPGPFQINNLPVITGNGQASIVVRDVLGQETTVTLPFFASSQLLREGLTSYDLDVGMLREGYGQQSFQYATPIAEGTYSIGKTNWLTLESHLEASKEVQLAGGGAIFSIAPYGVLHVASAVSHNDLSQQASLGSLHSVSLETDTHPVGFFGSVNATLGDYNDAATIGGTPPPELQMQVGSNISLGDDGAITASLIEIRQEHQDTAQLANLSYTVTLDKKFSVGATGFYDVTHHSLVTEAFLSVPLGENMIGNASVNAAPRSRQAQAGLTQPADPDGGLGYRLSSTDGTTSLQEGDVTWVAPHVIVDADLASQNGMEAARVTGSGGIVLMDGSLYATKRPDGAVALVQTGQPGTQIFRENREVATADENGEALLTGLVPFTTNRVSIDPTSYNFSTIVKNTEQEVTPRRQSGVLVDFVPVQHAPVIVVLRLNDGSAPASGSRVTLRDSIEPLVVGRHGEIFISDLRKPVDGRVDYGGGTCHFSVSPPSGISSDIIPRVGPLPCYLDQTL